MIRTAQQLKGKIRNLSMGDSAKAQMLMRTYATERFWKGFRFPLIARISS